MKIMDKINFHRNVMRSPGGSTVAEAIQQLAVAAIMEGRGSEAWNRYMSHFHSNPAQLSRLRGEDGEFMQSDWAETILAYVVSAGTCGGGTGMSLAVEAMPAPMQNFLDANLDSTTDQASDHLKITSDLVRFIG
jgi:hypothetical protein